MHGIFAFNIYVLRLLFVYTFCFFFSLYIYIYITKCIKNIGFLIFNKYFRRNIWPQGENYVHAICTIQLCRHLFFLIQRTKNNQQVSLNQRNFFLPYSNAQICLIQRNFFLVEVQNSRANISLGVLSNKSYFYRKLNKIFKKYIRIYLTGRKESK